MSTPDKELSTDNVHVVVRVRPLIQSEQSTGSPIHWAVKDNTIFQIDAQKKPIGQPYAFDRVFDSNCKTEDIFREVARPILNAVMDGYNGTIFAYGQTSSGKTHTMIGNMSNYDYGVIPRMVMELFNSIEKRPTRCFLLRVSYMEIYNESIYDLLTTKRKPLSLREDLNGHAFVKELKEEIVSNCDELLSVMKKGERNRSYATTSYNDASSRSHSIFRIIIESSFGWITDDANPTSKIVSNLNTEGCNSVMVSHLNLVDLAGSERTGRIGTTGSLFKEGCAINTSLFALKNVITKLGSQTADAPFINFRDSKLTRILKTSLGGNAKTSIICTVTPAMTDETESTLKFGSTAKTVKNRPIVNEILSEEALLKRYASEIHNLQKRLDSAKDYNEEEFKAMEIKLQESTMKNQELEAKIRQLTGCIVTSTMPLSLPGENYKSRRETWGGGNIRPATTIDAERLFENSQASCLSLEKPMKVVRFDLGRISESYEMESGIVSDAACQTDDDFSERAKSNNHKTSNAELEKLSQRCEDLHMNNRFLEKRLKNEEKRFKSLQQELQERVDDYSFISKESDIICELESKISRQKLYIKDLTKCSSDTEALLLETNRAKSILNSENLELKQAVSDLEEKTVRLEKSFSQCEKERLSLIASKKQLVGERINVLENELRDYDYKYELQAKQFEKTNTDLRQKLQEAYDRITTLEEAEFKFQGSNSISPKKSDKNVGSVLNHLELKDEQSSTSVSQPLFQDNGAQTCSYQHNMSMQTCPDQMDISIQTHVEQQDTGVQTCLENQDIDFQTWLNQRCVGIQTCIDQVDLIKSANSGFKRFNEAECQTMALDGPETVDVLNNSAIADLEFRFRDSENRMLALREELFERCEELQKIDAELAQTKSDSKRDKKTLEIVRKDKAELELELNNCRRQILILQEAKEAEAVKSATSIQSLEAHLEQLKKEGEELLDQIQVFNDTKSISASQTSTATEEEKVAMREEFDKELIRYRIDYENLQKLENEARKNLTEYIERDEQTSLALKEAIESSNAKEELLTEKSKEFDKLQEEMRQQIFENQNEIKCLKNCIAELEEQRLELEANLNSEKFKLTRQCSGSQTPAAIDEEKAAIREEFEKELAKHRSDYENLQKIEKEARKNLMEYVEKDRETNLALREAIASAKSKEVLLMEKSKEFDKLQEKMSQQIFENQNEVKFLKNCIAELEEQRLELEANLDSEKFKLTRQCSGSQTPAAIDEEKAAIREEFEKELTKHRSDYENLQKMEEEGRKNLMECMEKNRETSLTLREAIESVSSKEVLLMEKSKEFEKLREEMRQQIFENQNEIERLKRCIAELEEQGLELESNLNSERLKLQQLDAKKEQRRDSSVLERTANVRVCLNCHGELQLLGDVLPNDSLLAQTIQKRNSKFTEAAVQCVAESLEIGCNTEQISVVDAVCITSGHGPNFCSTLDASRIVTHDRICCDSDSLLWPPISGGTPSVANHTEQLSSTSRLESDSALLEEMSQLKEVNSGLRTNFFQLFKKSSLMREQLKEKNAEIEQLHRDLELSQAAVNDKISVNRGGSSRKKQLGEMDKGAVAMILRENAELKSHSEMLQSDNSRLHKTVNDLKDEKTSLEKEIKEKVDAFGQRSYEFMEKDGKSKDTITSLQKEVAFINKKLKSQNSQIKKQDIEIRRLNAENNRTVYEAPETEENKTRATATEDTEKWSGVYHTGTGVLAEYTADMASMMYKKLKIEMEELEAVNCRLQKEVNHYKRRCKESRNAKSKVASPKENSPIFKKPYVKPLLPSVDSERMQSDAKLPVGKGSEVTCLLTEHTDNTETGSHSKSLERHPKTEVNLSLERGMASKLYSKEPTDTIDKSYYDRLSKDNDCKVS